MQSWFKKYFVPHEANDHKPHIFRSKMSLILVLLVVGLQILFLTQIFIVFDKTNLLGAVLPGVLTSLTNENRATSALPPLSENALLDQAAQLKAEDMAQKGYFAHITPDGKNPWYFLDAVGYKYSYAGENLAVNFFESKDVADAWMNSPGHRANIVKKEYTEVGIGVASGIYEGRNTVFVAQFFGTPAKTAPTQKKTVPKLAAKTQPTERTVKEPEPAPVETKVLGEATDSVSAPQAKISKSKLFFDKILTAPKASLNYLYIGFLSFISLALLIIVAKKSDKKHPLIFLRGVSILFLVFAFWFINQNIFASPTEVPKDASLTQVTR